MATVSSRARRAFQSGPVVAGFTTRRIPSMNMLALSKNILRLSCLLSVAVAGAGCVGNAQEAGDDEAIGATQEAYSGYWGYSWSTASASQAAIDIGSDANKMCFLSGVGGDLESVYEAPEPPDTLYTTASANVSHGGGKYYLDVNPGRSPNKVKMASICLPISSPSQRGATVGWYAGQPAHVMAPVAAGRACFLTGIANIEPYYTSGEFSSSGDNVHIWHDAYNWYIGGSGAALGWGACIDGITSIGNPGQLTAGGSATTWNMTQQIDHGTTPLGLQCLLQGVGGVFRTSDYNNGVFVNYAAGTQEWSMTVSAGKTGWVNCVQ
jgi:hypothetical protein